MPLTTAHSVLLCNVESLLPFCGKVNSSCNQQIFILEPSSLELDFKYLYYFLLKNKEKVSQYLFSKSFFISLTKSNLLKVSIPLPTFEEQKKAIAELEQEEKDKENLFTFIRHQKNKRERTLRDI